MSIEYVRLFKPMHSHLQGVNAMGLKKVGLNIRKGLGSQQCTPVLYHNDTSIQNN